MTFTTIAHLAVLPLKVRREMARRLESHLDYLISEHAPVTDTVPTAQAISELRWAGSGMLDDRRYYRSIHAEAVPALEAVYAASVEALDA